MQKKLFCCDYNIAGQLFKFKNWHQPFILKPNFNCKTPNPIYVIIYSSSNEEYIGQTRGQVKKRLTIYNLQQSKYQKIEIERHLPTYAKRIFKFFLSSK